MVRKLYLNRRFEISAIEIYLSFHNESKEMENIKSETFFLDSIELLSMMNIYFFYVSVRLSRHIMVCATEDVSFLAFFFVDALSAAHLLA